MKKATIRSVMAATMLAGVVLGVGQVSDAEAAGVALGTVAQTAPVASASKVTSASPSATPAPVMRDNLFKFGLEKAVELPVTITSGGFSYTLEKLMFYDVKSKEAQALMQKYGYTDRIYKAPTKYMVWTKITIENKSNKVIQLNAKDQQEKWFLKIDGNPLLSPTPGNTMNEVNSKEALYTWVLKPGGKLSTYQMYGYIKDPTSISIYTFAGGVFDEEYIVNLPEE